MEGLVRQINEYKQTHRDTNDLEQEVGRLRDELEQIDRERQDEMQERLKGLTDIQIPGPSPGPKPFPGPSGARTPEPRVRRRGSPSPVVRPPRERGDPLHGDLMAYMRDEFRDMRHEIRDRGRGHSPERDPPPPGPPAGPGPVGTYVSHIPQPAAPIVVAPVITMPQRDVERKMADVFEKKAQAQRKAVTKKRGTTMTNLRKKYMDARREATANVRKEKHNATALMKKSLSRLPRNKRRFKELFGRKSKPRLSFGSSRKPSRHTA